MSGTHRPRLDRSSSSRKAPRLFGRSCTGPGAPPQDAPPRASHTHPRFTPAPPCKPWLMRSVANTAKNRRRASGRRERTAARAAARRPDGGGRFQIEGGGGHPQAKAIGAR